MRTEFYRIKRGGDRILPGRRFVLRFLMDERGWELFWSWNGVCDRKRRFHCLFRRLAFVRRLQLTVYRLGSGELGTKSNSTVDFIAPHEIFLAYHDFGEDGTSITDKSLL